MNPWVTRMDAWTAAGRGVEALAEAITRGADLRRPVPYAAPALRSPFAALVPEGVDAETLLESVVRGVLPATPGRCGLVVATTSGAISGAFEAWHRADPDPTADAAGLYPGELLWRQAPGVAVARRLGLAPHTTISVACASGTAAFAIARGWLRDGRCDRVVVAGVDALSLYIHAGFAGLGALAAERPQPFAAGRDGLLLGEGAAALLLEPPGSGQPIAAVLGVGMSQDAVHLTAPDRTGDGLRRAAATACGTFVDHVDCISAHGTSTLFNDAMEARAIDDLFGRPMAVHAGKSVVGHTLGAAGVVESVALLAYLQGAPPPPPLAAGDTVLRSAPAHAPRYGLKLSAAFGGLNAAVLFGPPHDAAAPHRAVKVDAHHSVSASVIPLPEIDAPPTLGRADLYVRAGIAALKPLALGPDTAVVLSSHTNCRAADLRYHQDLRTRGPAGVSRVHFAYTIPGAPLAEAAILRQLRGPALVLCDGPEAGRAEAEALIRHGDAAEVVALHVEAPGGMATAEATLLRAVR